MDIAHTMVDVAIDAVHVPLIEYPKGARILLGGDDLRLLVPAACLCFPITIHNTLAWPQLRLMD